MELWCIVATSARPQDILPINGKTGRPRKRTEWSSTSDGCRAGKKRARLRELFHVGSGDMPCRSSYSGLMPISVSTFSMISVSFLNRAFVASKLNGPTII